VTVMAGLPVIFPGVIWQGCAPRRFHTGKTPGKLFAMRCIPRARAPGKFTGKSAFPRAFSQFPGDLPPWNDQYSCSVCWILMLIRSWTHQNLKQPTSDAHTGSDGTGSEATASEAA
jgi:hypothetical protein